MNAEKFAEAALIFAALGDKTRLSIVARLCGEGPLSIVRLCEDSKISRQAVTKHLASLSNIGLIRSQLTGRERIFKLDPKRLAEARRHFDRISQQWAKASSRSISR